MPVLPRKRPALSHAAWGWKKMPQKKLSFRKVFGIAVVSVVVVVDDVVCCMLYVVVQVVPICICCCSCGRFRPPVTIWNTNHSEFTAGDSSVHSRQPSDIPLPMHPGGHC